MFFIILDLGSLPGVNCTIHELYTMSTAQDDAMHYYYSYYTSFDHMEAIVYTHFNIIYIVLKTFMGGTD